MAKFCRDNKKAKIAKEIMFCGQYLLISFLGASVTSFPEISHYALFGRLLSTTVLTFITSTAPPMTSMLHSN
jgi:hypothetical protein